MKASPAPPFYSIVKEQRDKLTEILFKRLKASSAPNYRKAKGEQLHVRCEKFVDAFLRSASGDPFPFALYVEKIAEERIAEGYLLAEIQLALRILEEETWAIAVDRSNWAGLVPHLTLITTTFGRGKDRLAQIYLEHKERAEVRAGDLERRLDGLFRGSEGVDVEDEPRRRR